MQARYRSDYAGEFVITETRWEGGKRTETREWIANPIENHHISGRATCISSSINQYKFNYTILQRHRGGLLGSKKLQTYGTSEIASQMRLDFAVETHPDRLTSVIDSGYCENNIVYTTARNCIDHPGLFYLIPYSTRLIEVALLPFLAAFDGHKEIFLLGYTKDLNPESLGWMDQINSVVRAYTGVKFYFVGEPTNIPELWLENANTQTMCYRDFIGYCDV